MPAAFHFSDLLPVMVSDLTACPEPVMLQAIREAARRFALDTEAWIVKMRPMDIVGKQQRYTLAPDFDGEIRRVAEVRQNTADGAVNGLDGSLTAPWAYHLEQPSDLVFVNQMIPQVSVVNGLEVKVALAPFIQSQDSALDWEGCFNVWADALTYHARMSLCLKPGKPWSNPKLGAYFQSLYDREVGRAKVEVERRFTDMTPTVTA